MSGPERLRLKRRLGDLPPDELVVNQPSPHKRSFTDSEQLKYVRHTEVEPLDNFTTPRGPVVQSIGRAVGRLQHGEARRTFQLSRTTGGKRKVRDEGPAITQGRQVRYKPRGNGSIFASNGHGERRDVAAPLKRPGRGAALRNGGTPKPETKTEPREDIQEIADELHQFALDEVAKTDKPKMTAMPKLPGARSRELHRQRVAMASQPPAPLPAITAAQDDTEMDDNDDDEAAYVYDTYVLVPASTQITPAHTNTNPTTQRTPPLPTVNIGYIDLTPADIEAWEMYTYDDDASDEDWDSQDEDENAERYHGADYPEDELAEDDEDGSGAYGYRDRAASDLEEWGEETGWGSGDEEEEVGIEGEGWRNWRKTPGEFLRGMVDGEGKGVE